jgi:hypothetical protein
MNCKNILIEKYIVMQKELTSIKLAKLNVYKKIVNGGKYFTDLYNKGKKRTTK